MGINRTGQEVLESIEVNAEQLDLNTDQLESLLQTLINDKATSENPETAQLTYVSSSDIDGTDYVSGSEGSVKLIQEGDDFSSGSVVRQTQFFYRDTTNPASPTELVESDVTL